MRGTFVDDVPEEYLWPATEELGSTAFQNCPSLRQGRWAVILYQNQSLAKGLLEESPFPFPGFQTPWG